MDIMKIQNKKTREPTLQRRRDRKKMLDRGRSGSRDLEVQSAGDGGESRLVYPFSTDHFKPFCGQWARLRLKMSCLG